MHLALLGFALAAPVDGAWISYEAKREVRGTGGRYAGYTDHLDATGRYTFAAKDAGISVHATYQWTYSSSEGETDRGDADRTVTVGPDRHYIDGIDLDDDEYAHLDPTTLATWLWIDPSSAVGGSLRILDNDCVVAGPSTPRDREIQATAIEVTCEGSFQNRTDSYGTYGGTFTDRWYFDAATGQVLAERYSEAAVELEGRFDRHDVVNITASSTGAVIAPPPPPPPPSATAVISTMLCACGLPTATVLSVSYALYALIRRTFWPSAKVQSAVFGAVTIRRVTDPTEPTTWTGVDGIAPHLAPFVPDMVQKALGAGASVFVAFAGDRIAGLACDDPESATGTVLSPCPDVTAMLLRWIKRQEFYCEARHGSPGQPTWNVLETYRVMSLSPVPTPPWDRALVRRTVAADEPAIAGLAKTIHKAPCEKWVRAVLASEDIAYLATQEGLPVGFAFLTLAGDVARLHGLSVLPTHGNRGIGGELMRARLAALAALGAQKVLTEVADGNPAAVHLALGAGFVEIGKMWLCTKGNAAVQKAPRR